MLSVFFSSSQPRNLFLFILLSFSVSISLSHPLVSFFLSSFRPLFLPVSRSLSSSCLHNPFPCCFLYSYVCIYFLFLLDIFMIIYPTHLYSLFFQITYFLSFSFSLSLSSISLTLSIYLSLSLSLPLSISLSLSVRLKAMSKAMKKNIL